MKHILLTLLLLSPFANAVVSQLAFGDLTDNSNLDMNIKSCFPFSNDNSACYSVYLSCDELVQILYDQQSHRPPLKNLFTDGIPKCVNEEFPAVGVTERKEIKKQLFTKCDIPCAVYRFPIKSSYSGRSLANILGRQKIFIEHEIKTTGNFNSAEIQYPWYRDWYAFMYDNRIYYTNKHNVVED